MSQVFTEPKLCQSSGTVTETAQVKTVLELMSECGGKNGEKEDA